MLPLVLGFTSIGVVAEAADNCLDYGSYIHWTAGLNTGYCGGSDLVISGSLAYVTAYCDEMLRIVDIADPDHPRLVGSLDTIGSAWDVAIAGSYAYVADDGGLRVIGVADPSNPVSVGRVEVLDAHAVDVSGPYAYVGTGDGHEYEPAALHVIDVADAANPAVVSTLELGGSIGDIGGLAVTDHYVYLVDEISESLYIVDVADPETPLLVNTLTFGAALSAVLISGNLAYVTGSGDLFVLDLSDPANPVLVGESTEIGGVSLAIAGSYLFTGDQVSDLTDPRNPRLLGEWSFGEGWSAVAAAGDRVFGAANGWLDVVDYTSLSTPEGPLANVAIPHVFGDMDLAIAGDYAYVARGMNGIATIGITDPLSPAVVRTLANVEVTVLATDGIRLVGANGGLIGSPLFHVFSITDPSNPSPLARIPTPGRFKGVAVRGDLAFAADESYGLHVIDIADPAAPRIVSTTRVAGAAWAVALYDQYALVADGYAGLEVIDIANPASPEHVGFVDLPGFASNVTTSGPLAFVSCDQAGIQVVDIADPANPALLATQDTPRSARAVFVFANDAYVADGGGGLQVIDAQDPLNLALIGGLRTGSADGWAERVIIRQPGPYAFVLNTSPPHKSLSVLPLQCAAATGVGTGEWPGGDARSTLRLTVSPNPGPDGRAFQIRARVGGDVEAAVFDAAGRRVRRLGTWRLEPADHDFPWDARDESGKAVSPGVYFVRVSCDAGAQTARLIVTR